MAVSDESSLRDTNANDSLLWLYYVCNISKLFRITHCDHDMNLAHYVATISDISVDKYFLPLHMHKNMDIIVHWRVKMNIIRFNYHWTNYCSFNANLIPLLQVV